MSEAKDTVLVSVCTMKGGEAKSTVTSLLANYIHNETDLLVHVSDCDDAQRTLSDRREDEIALLKEEGTYDPESMYELECMNPLDFPTQFEETIDGYFDVALVDLPGSLMQAGVADAMKFIDVLLVPVRLTPPGVSAAERFLNFYEKHVLQLRASLGLETQILGYLSWVNPQRKVYKEEGDIVKENLGIPFLDSFFPFNEKSFGEGFSTIDSYVYSTEKSYLDDFRNEVMAKLD